MSRALKRFRALRTFKRLTGVPWPVLLEAGLVIRGRWRSLSRRDRARLRALLRRSRGKPANLSPKERAELRALLLGLDPRALAAELARVWRSARRRKGGGWKRGALLAVRRARRS
ncbi:MAG: hypothetical protein KGJ43_04610 [Acidobacteriota bacterium]|nr:hypothetical protein [Acidobacteriota bacterium]